MWLWLLALTASAGDISGGGRVESHLRLGLDECLSDGGDCGFLDFADTLVVGGKGQVIVGPKVRVDLEGDLRLHAPGELALIEDLSTPAGLPTSTRIHRAVVELSEVGAKSIDLSIGAQKVMWGVSEKLHVANPVSPRNLENPLAFDSRLAVPSAVSRIRSDRLELQLVVQPLFTPAVLPRHGLQVEPPRADVLADDTFASDLTGDVETRITVPGPTASNMAGGARLWWASPVADVAISGAIGRDSLPQGDGDVVLTGFQTAARRVDVAVPLVFPRVGQAAVELRAPLWADVAGWAEVAVVIPSRTTLAFSRAQLQDLQRLGAIDSVPDPVPEVVTQDGQPYVRAIVGLERSFGPVTLTGQWLHGLPLERKAGELSELGALFIAFSASDRTRIDLRGLSDLDGALIAGGITTLHGDAVELSIGGAWAGGSEDSALDVYRGSTQVQLGTVVHF